MRVNQFVAHATGISRREIDLAISNGRVKVNGKTAVLGQLVEDIDKVSLNNKIVELPKKTTILIINKPVGYVCSRDGQGSPTIYDLVPAQYQKLNYAGRLDKESSGLVVLSDDGDLVYELTHPKFSKSKLYSIELNKQFETKDKHLIETGRVSLDGKPSIMRIINSGTQFNKIKIELFEGRNRQIRRTFSKLGYEVTKLRRDALGKYKLSQLEGRTYIKVEN
jgi:23S rRNA pseudouridine2605 synthase